MNLNVVLLGTDVEHSLSPQIHRQFAHDAGVDLDYRVASIDRDAFKEAVQSYRAQGVNALNITMPFKAEAYAYATEHSGRAVQAGSVNTLVFRRDGSVYGDNTDGVGFVADCEKNHIPLSGQSVLLLGAGGAARGLLPALCAQAPARLAVYTRRWSQGEALLKTVNDVYGSMNCVAVSAAALSDCQPSVVINATGAYNEAFHALIAPVLAGSPTCTYYDLLYGARAAANLAYMRAQGVTQCFDGYGMLVQQAKALFQLWLASA